MLEIINLVQDWAGGPVQAMAWYRAEPIPAFGGRTAETLVKSGKATAVRDYLDHLATGGYARGSGASASAPMIPAGPGARFRAPVRRSREGASTGRGWKRFISRFP